MGSTYKLPLEVNYARSLMLKKLSIICKPYCYYV
ncbi:hypothetical protein N7281_05505 [Rickettsia hoogstraalii]|nr:hypothetical protein [Rickettsia hoogstraalii]